MLNLHTEYSCTGDYKRPMESNVCFAKVFRELGGSQKKSIKYVIRIYSGLCAAKKKSWNNACFLSRRELRNHIDQLKGIIPFKAKIISKKEGDLNFFEVILEIDNIKGIYHKFILTWIRYAYEFPYNMFLMEACKLRKVKPFMFDSIANLFNLVGSSVSLGGGHTIGYGGTIGFLQRKELAARIGRVTELNNVYKHSYEGKHINTRERINNKELSWYDLDFWKNEELFQKRIPVYLEKYKKIKQKK